MHNYVLQEINDQGDTIVKQERDDGKTRTVSDQHQGYLKWLNGDPEDLETFPPHMPEVIAYVPPVVPDPPTLEELKTSLSKQAYSRCAAMLDNLPLPYSSSEKSLWADWDKAIKQGDLDFFTPYVTGTGMTEQEYLDEVTVTRTQFKALETGNINNRNKHKKAISKLATVEEAQAYDVSTGWLQAT